MIFMINLILLQTTYYTKIDTHFIKTQIKIIIFHTFGRTVPSRRDLSISVSCNDKYVSIIIKLKSVNSDNINDIYDKLNFTTNYILYKN